MIDLDFVPSGNKTVKKEMSCNPGILGQQEQADIDSLLILTWVNIYSILIIWNERIDCHKDSPQTYTKYIKKEYRNNYNSNSQGISVIGTTVSYNLTLWLSQGTISGSAAEYICGVAWHCCAPTCTHPS